MKAMTKQQLYIVTISGKKVSTSSTMSAAMERYVNACCKREGNQRVRLICQFGSTQVVVADCFGYLGWDIDEEDDEQ